MAGDWIKMRTNLWDDPRVSRLCDLTGHAEAAIVGALYWLWSAADDHSEDGRMEGLSVAGVDRKTGVAGIGKALVDIGWIDDAPGGIVIARFDDHNGNSAKRRCQDATRKGSVRTVSAKCPHEKRTDCGQPAELESEKRKISIDRSIGVRPTDNSAGSTDGPITEAEWQDIEPILIEKSRQLHGKDARKPVARKDWMLVAKCLAFERRYGANLLDRVSEAVRSGRAAKPFAYLQGAMLKECESRGLDGHRVLAAIDCPFRPEPQPQSQPP